MSTTSTNPTPLPPRARAAAIQHLSVFVACLDWVSPTDGNYILCGRVRTLIKRILDHVLALPLAYPVPSAAGTGGFVPLAPGHVDADADSHAGEGAQAAGLVGRRQSHGHAHTDAPTDTDTDPTTDVGAQHPAQTQPYIMPGWDARPEAPLTAGVPAVTGMGMDMAMALPMPLFSADMEGWFEGIDWDGVAWG